jgi:eukaryotic-like serine/threonine-protein kinase
VSLVLTEGLRLRSGRYELERRLGAGAAASVWLARDTLLERPVAVKVLAEGLVADRAWLARFRREARIAARLQHPNLVSIYDFNADVERPYLVMAYMPGGSLQDRLDAGGKPDAERLAADVLRALAHIHAAGIIHRDVKPGNVLLDRDGRASLTDFGVARPQDATSITQTGQIPGTARYMAPELWRGEQATERSDLFAAGVLLSQCLDDDSPARLIGLTERLSAENPELRPESAPAALALIDAGAVPQPFPPSEPEPELESQPELEPEPETDEQEWAPPPAGTPRTATRPSRWVPVVALCLVALVAGFALANGLGGDEEEPPAETAAEEPQRDASTGDQPSRSQESNEPEQQTTPPATEETTPPAGEPAETASDPVALNEQGFELINQGRYEEAIPILEQAVAGLEGSGDINYAYALYNLGNALLLAGRPGEAVPILEQRLEIPNQRGTVAATLAQARAALRGESGGSGDD